MVMSVVIVFALHNLHPLTAQKAASGSSISPISGAKARTPDTLIQCTAGGNVAASLGGGRCDGTTDSSASLDMMGREAVSRSADTSTTSSLPPQG